MSTRLTVADEFLRLDANERREIINAAAPNIGLLPAVVEKDVWVCWVLNVLFTIPGGRPLVFKGGTSLSTAGLALPNATIDALKAERTFWEKATLIHAELNTGKIEKTAERMSRHWSDLSILMKTKAGERAIADAELRSQVVTHKDKFWRDSKARYEDCLNKKLRLVPTGEELKVLQSDYQEMVKMGMFFGTEPATFEEMISDIALLESILNA